MKHTIALPVHGITVTLPGDGTGKIESGLERETCSCCHEADCCYDCDGSQGAYDKRESDEEVVARLKHNASLDAVEALVLAQAIVGVNIKTPAYYEALETVIDAIGNNI